MTKRMTREEAKGNLIHAIRWNDMPKKEALEVAVKALDREPCDDAISRQAALNKKNLIELDDGQSFYCISPEDVEALQPVTPQPKMGRWIYGEDNLETGRDGWYCNQCGHFEFWDYSSDIKSAKLNLPNPCPNCGAKMIVLQERSE